MPRLFVGLLYLLAQCGCGGWADADVKAATDTVRLESMALSLCGGGGGGDGGSCAPGQVRALERAAYCLNASQLVRHGDEVPDAGVSCQAP
jgi:hypothetical protein